MSLTKGTIILTTVLLGCWLGCSSSGSTVPDGSLDDTLQALSDATRRDGRSARPDQKPACAPGPESTLAACTDGCNNDGDQYVDCDDKDCCSVLSSCPTTTYCGKSTTKPSENTVTLCNNGGDDDSDGKIDCEDVTCCGVRDCPSGTGCSPSFCLDGIVELWATDPAHPTPVLTYLKSTTVSTAGPFYLYAGGLDINWHPSRTTPYSTSCVAVDKYIKSPTCQVNVQTQQWKDSTCGVMRGTISLAYQDGTGRSYQLIFATAVGMTEAAVSFQ